MTDRTAEQIDLAATLKVIDEIDSVGNSMSKGIERGASKVGGFIKGLFKKK